MKIEDIKIGTKIYRTIQGQIESVLVVDRITPTMLICGNSRFRIKHGRLDSVGAGLWNFYSYQIENDDLNAQYKKNLLIKRIRNKVERNSIASLSIEVLESIYNTLP